MTKVLNTQSKPGAQPQGPASAISQQLGIDKGHCAIVGMQWGDEGKGKIVDLLCSGFDYVVRYNGGANAGHSIQVGEQRYALHLIPSGILDPEKINMLGNGVVIDLAQVVKEITELRQRGVTIKDNLRISNRAHLVMPYHKLEDVFYEKAAAYARGDKSAIGTTGRGIGPCYADKALRTTAVRAGDLLDLNKLEQKLKQIVEIKNATLKALATYSHSEFEPLDSQAIFNEIAQLAGEVSSYISDTNATLQQAIKSGQRLLFEGANATLLDIDHGTYPYVTSSNCSSLGVYTGAGIAGHRVENIIGIVKAYQTRVGGGPMPTELHDDTGNQIREKGNEYGTTTGRPRRCGWLDLVALKYSVELTGATSLSLMLLDVLAGLKEIKVCTGYELSNQALDHFPAEADALEKIKPVYETLEGFGEAITDCTRFDELPKAAVTYIKRIEDFIGVPIALVSVGPKRSQTIVHQR